MCQTMKNISSLLEVRLILPWMYGQPRGTNFIRLIPIKLNIMISSSVWRQLWSGAGPVKSRYLPLRLIRPAHLRVSKNPSHYPFPINPYAPVLTTWPCMAWQSRKNSRSPFGACIRWILPNLKLKSHNPMKSTWMKSKTVWFTLWKTKTND